MLVRTLFSSESLSRLGQQQTLTSSTSLPSTEQCWSSRLKITCTGRRLGPPMSELRHMNFIRHDQDQLELEVMLDLDVEVKLELEAEELELEVEKLEELEPSFSTGPRGATTDKRPDSGSSQ